MYFEIITSQLDDASLVTSLFPVQKLGGINKLSAFANVDLEGCVSQSVKMLTAQTLREAGSPSQQAPGERSV